MTTVKILDGDGVLKYFSASGAGTEDDPFSLNQNREMTGPQRPMFVSKLDTVGDGAGATDMNVDGSSTSVVFRIKPDAGEVFRVARWILMLRDSASLDSGGWGNNGGSPLGNGLLVEMVQDGVVFPLLDGIRSHVDIAALCHDLTHHSWGAGDEFLTARWSFTKMGQFVRLIGDLGDELRVTVRDDLTHLVEQTIYAQGYVE